MMLRRTLQLFSKMVNDEFVGFWGMIEAIALERKRKRKRIREGEWR